MIVVAVRGLSGMRRHGGWWSWERMQLGGVVLFGGRSGGKSYGNGRKKSYEFVGDPFTLCDQIKFRSMLSSVR